MDEISQKLRFEEDLKIKEIESNLLPPKHVDTFISKSKSTPDSCDKESFQRLLQYSLSDGKFEKDYQTFCSGTTPLTSSERTSLFTFIAKYVEQESFTDDEMLEIMPQLGNFLSPLPCKYAPVVGAAGTGKTTATANMMFKSNTITVCGATNSAFGNFMAELKPNVKPGSYSKLLKQTIYKLANVKYGDPFIKLCLQNINKNKELSDSYKNLIENTSFVRHKEDAYNFYYQHMQTVLKALHPLLFWIIKTLKASFQPQYRLEITDTNHPYYQPESEKFNFVQESKVQLARTCSKACNNVASINAYQTLVMMQCSEPSLLPNKEHLLPNIMTLVNTIVIDEAGRLPAYFNTITCFIWWFLQFAYNTPMLYESIPVISPSGSDSQSNVIDFPVSMLDEVISPLLICNPTDVLAYKSEHNRRKINAFTDLKTSMHNATCLSLENFQINDFTYKTFMFSETFPELLKDPRIKPNAIRMFPYHQNCDQFIQAMHTHGNANIETRDNIFVSSDITVVHDVNFNHADVDDLFLSTLTEEEAQMNRLNMWKAKKQIYSDGCIIPDQNYKDKLTNSVPMSDDTNFKENVEEALQEVYAKMQSQHEILAKERKRKLHQQMTNEELEEMQYVEYMQKFEATGSYHTPCQQDIRYICGPATSMLSQEEHRIKRIHAKGIAKELGDGSNLSRHYYSASIALGQKPVMQYDPKYDICIEIADPNYTADEDLLKDSISKSVNARILYMCISRKRYFCENSSVVSGTHQTSLTLHGVSGKVNEIIYSECFGSANTAFRLLVYGGILEEFRKWTYSLSLQRSNSNVDILSMDKDHVRDLGTVVNIPQREREIIQSFEQILLLSCDKSSKEFKHINPDINSKVCLNVLELHDSLKRLVMRALSISQDFGETQIRYFVCNSEITEAWRFLLRTATQPFYLDKTQYCNHGDLITLGAGLSSVEKKKLTFRYGNMEWERKMVGRKTLFSIISRTIHDIFPDLIAHTSMTLLLKGILIANTNPSIALQNVRLFNILNHKSSLYGLMMRSNAASLPQKTDMLMHKVFTVNGGECMNFPRPFIVNGTDKPSNIVLKCKGNTFPFSSLSKGNDENIPTKKIESFAVLPLMNPMFSQVASTIDSMQGRTMNGESMVDLCHMNSSKLLVAVTRNKSSHSLFTSNVSAAVNTKIDPALNVQVKQSNKKIISSYFKYR